MPPDMAVSMRHTKLKAEEAALLAGEVNKPSWESRNEGIHERVSFEDTIWGFDLAGGSFYKTPLRVTYVKPDSRAAKAGIRPGDRLKRINDIDTSTLTIQEAHEIIIEAGIHLKLAVTAPEDEEDAYYCYEDEVVDEYDSDEERRKEEEKAKKRQVHARVSHYWSLQWPWVSKRRVIYRESNCFMVPSKFEEKNRDKFPIQPSLREQEDIVLDSLKKLKLDSYNDNKTEYERLMEKTKKVENLFNGTPEPIKNKNEEKLKNTKDETAKKSQNTKADGYVSDDEDIAVNGNTDKEESRTKNGHLLGIPEADEEKNSDLSELEESAQEISEADTENAEENSSPIVDLAEEAVLVNGKEESRNEELIEELLNGHDESISEEEEKVLDSILNESDR